MGIERREDGSLKIRGIFVPGWMYGTAWKEGATRRLTRAAFTAGFRAVDTANQRRHYFERAVGEGLADAMAAVNLSRDDVFIQTKFTYPRSQDHRIPYDLHAPPRQQVVQSFESSLEHLQVDHIDAYLLHGPSVREGLSDRDWEVYGAMEGLFHSERVRLLGVSNVTAEQLALLLSRAEILPAFVQNRCYASKGWDREVRRLCEEHEMVYQGFSLLTANREVLAHPRVREVANRLACSAAQVVFSLALELDMLPLTGTSSDAHMAQDLACRVGQLTEDEVVELEALVG